jgi:hypothetical protein
MASKRSEKRPRKRRTTPATALDAARPASAWFVHVLLRHLARTEPDLLSRHARPDTPDT